MQSILIWLIWMNGQAKIMSNASFTYEFLSQILPDALYDNLNCQLYTIFL